MQSASGEDASQTTWSKLSNSMGKRYHGRRVCNTLGWLLVQSFVTINIMTGRFRRLPRFVDIFTPCLDGTISSQSVSKSLFTWLFERQHWCMRAQSGWSSVAITEERTSRRCKTRHSEPSLPYESMYTELCKRDRPIAIFGQRPSYTPNTIWHQANH